MRLVKPRLYLQTEVEKIEAWHTNNLKSFIEISEAISLWMLWENTIEQRVLYGNPQLFSRTLAGLDNQLLIAFNAVDKAIRAYRSMDSREDEQIEVMESNYQIVKKWTTQIREGIVRATQENDEGAHLLGLIESGNNAALVKASIVAIGETSKRGRKADNLVTHAGAFLQVWKDSRAEAGQRMDWNIAGSKLLDLLDKLPLSETEKQSLEIRLSSDPGGEAQAIWKTFERRKR